MKKILISIIVLLTIYSSVVTYKLSNVSPDIVQITDTIPGDVVFKDTVIYKPQPYVVVVPQIDTFKIPTDTAMLIAEYKKTLVELYTSKTYLDTLKNDSSATVILTTHIHRNALDSLKMSFKNNRATVINTTIINEAPLFKAGVLFGYKTITPLIEYKLNNKFSAIGGYDILNKNPQVGIFYNIK